MTGPDTSIKLPPGTSPPGGPRPSLDVDQSFSDYQVGGQLAWELDFWGRFRRAIEASDAELEAAYFDYDATTAEDVLCQVTTSDSIGTGSLQYSGAGSPSSGGVTVAGTRGFGVTQGATFTANLICANVSDTLVIVLSSSLTAMYFPNS